MRRPAAPLRRGASPDAAAHDVESLRAAARRRLPRAVFDYVDGGAEDELSVQANRLAYARCRLRRHARVGGEPDTSSELFGKELSAPIGLAPTGYTRMVDPAGEIAVARAALTRSVPYALSTVGTTSIEAMANSGHDQLWFQLYVLRDRGLSADLVDRAAAAGMAALELTVDTPASGLRSRDLRNGLTIPPQLSLRTVADLLAHVGYWSDMLRSPPFRFANLEAAAGSVERITTQFDPSLTWDDLASLRDRWPRALIVKGPLGARDAKRAVEAGADAIHLSNHGGRQLDRCCPALFLLGPVRDAVGASVPIIIDSGIRCGADVAIALSLGADLCAVGRPYLYGLAAGGQAGVVRTIDILTSELREWMRLLGAATIAELREHGAEAIE